jgi:hypothetical protein
VDFDINLILHRIGISFTKNLTFVGLCGKCGTQPGVVLRVSAGLYFHPVETISQIAFCRTTARRVQLGDEYAIEKGS